jgi:DNA-binding NarL/FixJ family response regulator
VLIVDNQGIMGAGIEKLLSEEGSLEVFGLPTESEEGLVQNILSLQPDIIILILESQSTTSARLFELLPDYGRLRIILVSMNSNLVEVFDKKQITANNLATFVGKIKN